MYLFISRLWSHILVSLFLSYYIKFEIKDTRICRCLVHCFSWFVIQVHKTCLMMDNYPSVKLDNKMREYYCILRQKVDSCGTSTGEPDLRSFRLPECSSWGNAGEGTMNWLTGRPYSSMDFLHALCFLTFIRCVNWLISLIQWERQSNNLTFTYWGN